MPVFQPPPTWAEVVLIDENTKQPKFNPVWLKWFVDLVGIINASGGGAGVIQHNMTGGLQGGTANEFYHLTQEKGDAVNTEAIPAAWSVLTPLGNPTYNQLQEIHDLTRSAGQLTGGDITDAGSQTVAVAAGTGLIRASDDDTSTLFPFNWPAPSNLAIPTDTVRYVTVEYNAGNPQVVLYTSETYNYRTAFPLGFVVNEEDILYINDTPHAVGRAIGRLLRRNYEVDGRSRANALGGLIISESGSNGTLAISAGVTWLRGTRETFDAFDSNTSDDFDRYYRDGSGGWTMEPDETAVPDGLYDDGSGTPQPIGNNNHAVYFWYLGPASGIVMVYGRGDFNTQAQAEAAQPPTDLPLRIQVGSIYLGKFVQLKSTPGPVYSIVAVIPAFNVS
jgi:hypothetical protein